MVLITIVAGAYKPTYNWGASHCMIVSMMLKTNAMFMSRAIWYHQSTLGTVAPTVLPIGGAPRHEPICIWSSVAPRASDQLFPRTELWIGPNAQKINEHHVQNAGRSLIRNPFQDKHTYIDQNHCTWVAFQSQHRGEVILKKENKLMIHTMWGPQDS